MVVTKKSNLLSGVRKSFLAVGLFFLIPTIQENETHYHNYDELTDALQRVVRAHSDIATIESLGRTLEGRDIWVVQLANRDGIPLNERPGLLIVGNLEGGYLVGSEVALGTVEYLLQNYSTDADVRDRLDNHVIYVVPRLNPDAAEFMFESVQSGRHTNTRPYDGDNDARVDEDGPEDLNGDGQITVMRVLDPTGPYMIHPDDDRLMKEAEAHKGESGDYRIYWEGIDNDGDGFYNEDGPGGVDLNRNFQHEYPYNQSDAGPHMVSEQESRALMDFVVSHRNIAMVLTFGGSDNLVSAPSAGNALASAASVNLLDYASESFAGADTVGTFQIQLPGRGFGFGFGGYFRRGAAPAPRPLEGRQPNKVVHRRDAEYFKAISEQYGEITGITQIPMKRAPQGAFFEFAYYQFGVPAFSTPGWGLPEAETAGNEGGDETAPAARQRPPGGAGPMAMRRTSRGSSGGGSNDGRDLALLNWMDAENVDGFVEWTEFEHPTLGNVEIGGFEPYAIMNPPTAELAALSESHARFAVYLTSLFADVQIADVEVSNHGGGVFEIRAQVENAGFLPTALAQGVASRSVAPTMVQLDVAPENVLTGDRKTSFFQALNGSGTRESYTWVIRGRAGDRIELRVRSQKGGTDTETITLR